MFAKRILKSAAVLLAASVLMVACGGQAQAQVIPLSYKTTAGYPFSLKSAQKIVGQAGGAAITVTNFDGAAVTSTVYTDSSAQVYTQITSDPAFLASWINVSGTRTWVNTDYMAPTRCLTSKSYVTYITGASESYADNCMFFNTYLSRSN